jgi:probable rRNA maturation factor
MPKSATEFDLSITAVTGRELVTYLRKHLIAARAGLAPPLAELSVALVGDKTMAELHLRFMNIPGPTDVLTFPLEHDRRGRVTAGEVVVCIPEAKRRCRESGVELKNEVLLYALHGMLHLCGFDDRTPRGFGRMHRAEDRILTRLGAGPVFGIGRPAAARRAARARDVSGDR